MELTETEYLILKINTSIHVFENISYIEREIAETDMDIKKSEICFKAAAAALAVLGAASVVCAVFGIFFIIPFAAGALVLAVWAYGSKSESRRNAEKLRKDLENAKLAPEIDWLPPEYRTGSDYAKISEYIRRNQASTLQEALDLADEEKMKR